MSIAEIRNRLQIGVLSFRQGQFLLSQFDSLLADRARLDWLDANGTKGKNAAWTHNHKSVFPCAQESGGVPLRDAIDSAIAHSQPEEPK